MKAERLTKETITALGQTIREFPEFAVGDAIAVSQWITEGNKKRLQVFEGDVIAFHRNGASTTFTVRKIGANSISVERIYPYYSPVLDSIKIVRKGDVRRAKLYYVRDRVGKKARIKERVMTKDDRAAEAKKQKELLDTKKATVAKLEAAKKQAEAVSNPEEQTVEATKKVAAPEAPKKTEATAPEKDSESKE